MYNLPFAADGRPFFDNQPWLGGTLRIITTATANTNLVIPHQLKATPRGLIIIYSNGVFNPKWMSYKAWDTKNIYIQLDTTISTPNTITLFIF